MSRVSMFNSPLLLGFEHFERALDRVSKTASDGYPPYNIERLGEDHLRITLAVAGFGPDDLEVRVEDTQLVIRGRQSENDDPNRVFLYRGIAGRQFQRSFVLSEGIEVIGASLDNGLLHVDMQRIKPEPQVRTVRIDTSGSTRRNVTTRRDDVQARESAARQGEGANGPARNAGRTSRG